MSTIYWSGKSTNGVLKWKYEADSFKELFDLLMEKEIINDPDYDVYDRAVLNKYRKTEDAPEFEDEDGYLDYDKISDFVEGNPLTDQELWLLISEQNGNAYYQTFERGCDGQYVSIDPKDFDENGKFKY